LGSELGEAAARKINALDESIASVMVLTENGKLISQQSKTDSDALNILEDYPLTIPLANCGLLVFLRLSDCARSRRIRIMVEDLFKFSGGRITR
jgi:hypothetical protein